MTLRDDAAPPARWTQPDSSYANRLGVLQRMVRDRDGDWPAWLLPVAGAGRPCPRPIS